MQRLCKVISSDTVVHDLKNYSVRELLKIYVAILADLRRRDVIRTMNSPAGDYAELLASKAMNLRLEGSSSSGYDAICDKGHKYQIKSRRLTSANKSRQLSAIRNLDKKPFDYLVGILFNEDYTVYRACLIPHDAVCRHCTFTKHVNAHRFLLRDQIWLDDAVRDVTEDVRAAAELV